jgi:hypothetical protein
MNQKLKYFIVITTSLLIAQSAQAFQSTESQKPTTNPQKNLISSKCSNEGLLKYPQKFYQVKTESTSLSIRATPGGRVIGLVPSGWQIYVSKFDRTGRWAYIRDIYSPYYFFGSAPDFRSDGWVNVDYLQYLGQYCDKPNRLSLLPENLPVAVNTDNLTDTIWHSLASEMLSKLNATQTH